MRYKEMKYGEEVDQLYELRSIINNFKFVGIQSLDKVVSIDINDLDKHIKETIINSVDTAIYYRLTELNDLLNLP